MIRANVQYFSKVVRQCFHYARIVPGYFAVQSSLLVLGLLFTSLGVAMPVLIKFLIDTVMTTRNYDLVFNYFVGMIGLSFVSLLGATWQGWINLRHSQKVGARLQAHFTKKILRRNLLFHINVPPGQTLSRLQTDTATFTDFISKDLNKVLVLILQTVVMFVILVHLNWKLALLAVVNVPLYGCILLAFHSARKRLATATTQKHAELTGTMQEAFGNIKLVKVYALELFALRRIGENIRQVVSLSFDSFRVNFWFGFTLLVALSAGPLLVLIFGIQNVKHNLISIGSLYLFINYMGRMLAPVEGMKNFAGNGLKAKIALDRLEEYAPPASPRLTLSARKECERLSAPVRSITLRQISFAYPEQPLLFKDLDAVFELGKSYALCGANGSGKSTLVGLMLGLYEPVSGQIEYDGIALSRLASRDLHRRVVMVPQESLFFNDTVWENLILGRRDISRETVDGVCKAMRALEKISRLPKGYETNMGESGLKLSGGERQRLALARALLLRPQVLILDEALSEIDEATEPAILQEIQGMLRDKILIMISHRTTIQEHVDETLWLANFARSLEGTLKMKANQK